MPARNTYLKRRKQKEQSVHPSFRSHLGKIGGLAIAAALVAAFALPPVARSADEPDLIFKRSTVFKWLTPNDKLASTIPRSRAWPAISPRPSAAA